jgi:hypothetical protein
MVRQKMVDLLGKMSNGTEHGEFMVLIYSEQCHLNTLEIRGLPQPVAQVRPHIFLWVKPIIPTLQLITQVYNII